MSATVLVSGKLFRDPERKTSGKGTPYALATIREGQGADGTFWRVMAFSESACEELLALKTGDAVAVSGTLRAEIYTGGAEPRVSLTVTADRAISAKRQKRERGSERKEQPQTKSLNSRGRPFDDGVPF